MPLKPTHRQLAIMQHALGVDKYGRGAGHRNYFCAGAEDEADCRAMVDSGFMAPRAKTAVYRDYNCSVSADGREYVDAHSETPPKLSRAQQRYRDFLKADSGLSFREWLEYRPWREV